MIGGGELNDVAAISASDAWAVRFTVPNPQPLVFAYGPPLIEHWNGRQWRRVAVSTKNMPLFAVAALSASDVWAVGGSRSAEAAGVILHWDGGRWRRVVSDPNVELSDIVAISTRDIWAVGSADDDTAFFAMHFDGLRWQSFTGPAPGDQFSWLSSVAAVSANNVWAVGEAQSGNTLRDPVVYRWNGRRWRTTNSPPVGGGLLGIAVRSANEIWTVGWDDPVLSG